MGEDKATSGSEPGGPTGGEPMPDRVGSKQEVGDARNNVKGKGSPETKNGWTPKKILTPKFEGRIEGAKRSYLRPTWP